jgi:hypothetical protein
VSRRRTVRGLLGVATAPAGAPPFWLIRTKIASFFSAAGAMFVLTATISLWVRTALFVSTNAGSAVALETSTRTTTAATRKRRNIRQGYAACRELATKLAGGTRGPKTAPRSRDVAGSSYGRFQRAIKAGQVFHAENAARELGGLNLAATTLASL